MAYMDQEQTLMTPSHNPLLQLAPLPLTADPLSPRSTPQFCASLLTFNKTHFLSVRCKVDHHMCTVDIIIITAEIK